MLSTLVAAVLMVHDHQPMNTLTDAERRAGWKLLFDGKTTDAWKTFKGWSLRPGWVVKEGTLSVEDPGNAGDIMTKEQFKWFRLSIEYNVAKGHNSGIMFHVTEQEKRPWMTGPEVQIFDNASNPDVQKAGWLYELYSSDKDATKPAGEWNHLLIVVEPNLCYTEMNGVRYYEYQLGSEDFNRRVAKSKFAKMPNFAKAEKGSIALQGDHGLVKFRNIKVLPSAGR